MIKAIAKKCSSLYLLIGMFMLSMVSAVPSFAAGALETEVDTLTLTDGTAAVIAAFGIIAAGLTVIWGIRKLIKIWNRS